MGARASRSQECGQDARAPGRAPSLRHRLRRCLHVASTSPQCGSEAKRCFASHWGGFRLRRAKRCFAFPPPPSLWEGGLRLVPSCRGLSRSDWGSVGGTGGSGKPDGCGGHDAGAMNRSTSPLKRLPAPAGEAVLRLFASAPYGSSLHRRGEIYCAIMGYIQGRGRKRGTTNALHPTAQSACMGRFFMAHGRGRERHGRRRKKPMVAAYTARAR